MTELEDLQSQNEELKPRFVEFEAKEKARQETTIKRGKWFARFILKFGL